MAIKPSLEDITDPCGFSPDLAKISHLHARMLIRLPFLNPESAVTNENNKQRPSQTVRTKLLTERTDGVKSFRLGRLKIDEKFENGYTQRKRG